MMVVMVVKIMVTVVIIVAVRSERQTRVYGG